MKQHKHGGRINGKQRTLFRCFFTGSCFNSKVDFKTNFDQLSFLDKIALGGAHMSDFTSQNSRVKLSTFHQIDLYLVSFGVIN